MKTLNMINEVMKALEDIDMLQANKKKFNQLQLNKAYKILDNFRDELIRVNIEKGGTKEDD